MNHEENQLATGTAKSVLLVVVLVLITAGLGVASSVRQNSRVAAPLPSETPRPSNALAVAGEPAPLIDRLSPPSAPAWTTYENVSYRYAIGHPVTMLVKGTPTSDYVEVGKQIAVVVSEHNPEACRGDCDSILTAADVTVDNLPARRLVGVMGPGAGIPPQKYISVVVPRNGRFYIVTLNELPSDAAAPADRQPGDIPTAQIEVFDQILASLHFTP